VFYLTDKKETEWAKRWREAQEEEKEKERLKTEYLAELEEEDKPEKPTEEQREKWRRDERKDAILDEIERQLEESKQQDAQTKEIAELKNQLKTWRNILDNPRWDEILRTYFRVVYAMTKGMCAKTVVTITEKDGVMNFSYDYFDANGAPIVTELSDGAKEALDKEKELD
jgi:hypothetical protein